MALFVLVIGRDYTIPTNVFVSLAPAALSKPSLIAWLIKNTGATVFFIAQRWDHQL